MTDNTENQSDADLHLAERLIELTKFVEKNTSIIEDIQEDLDKKNQIIIKLNKELEEKELGLEERFEKYNQKIDSLSIRIDTNLTKFTSLNDQSEHHANQLAEILQIQKDMQDKILFLNQTLEEIKSEVNRRVTEERFETFLSDAIEEIRKNIILLKQTQEKMQSDMGRIEEETKNHFDTLVNTIELIGKGLEELDLKSETHSKYLEDQRHSIIQFKQGLKDIINQTKEDQKLHFENFSRIIESFNENIHTEITLTTQSLKESDINILNEISAHYMRKKVGKELQDKINDLTNELEAEAKKTREELVKGLEKTVSEYETIMEQQTSRIKNYQQELEQFQDEILAIIERKVNEKYEVIFSLLSSVAAHAEELALFIKTTELQIPRSLPELAKNVKMSPIAEKKLSETKKIEEVKSFSIEEE